MSPPSGGTIPLNKLKNLSKLRGFVRGQGLSAQGGPAPGGEPRYPGPLPAGRQENLMSPPSGGTIPGWLEQKTSQQ